MISLFPRDTSIDAIRVQHQALRKLGIAGRAAMTFQLGDNLRSLSESGVRLHHPEYDERQVRAATATRTLGRELSRQIGEDLGRGRAMSQQDFFARIVSALDSAQIPFMVVGSLASSLRGEPRATRGADIVIKTNQQSLAAFLTLIGEEFYVSREAAEQAVRQQSMFNVIDAASGWKVDLIVSPSTPFGDQSFSRRIWTDIMGVRVAVQSPEDTILSKLQWGKESGSEMQYRDALGVALQQWERLDQEYLRHWAPQLDVSDILQSLLAEASKLA
jgi:hypothetical protein